MGWTLTKSEKREEKRLKREFKRKYCKKTKNQFSPVDRAKLRKWRLAVLKGDNYTCQRCGLTESLHAHHKQWQINKPELRYKVKNGLTLCENCHDCVHDGLIEYYKQQAFLRQIVNE